MSRRMLPDIVAKVAERGREEARKLAAVKAEAESLWAREQAAQVVADDLRGELAGIIRGRGGLQGVLLRPAGA